MPNPTDPNPSDVLTSLLTENTQTPTSKQGNALPGLPVPSEQQWSQEILPCDRMPCPFCGGMPTHVRWKHPTWAHRHQIICMNKECQTTCATTQQKSYPKAVEVWENRPRIQKLDVDELLADFPIDEMHEA